MRLRVVSDVHLEFQDPESDRFWESLCSVPAGAYDGLLLAGDVTNWRRSRQEASREALARAADAYDFVLYVPGNHEYYGTYAPTLGVEEMARDAGAEALDCASFEHAGVRFHGATGWFPKVVTDATIADHHVIRGLLPWAWERNEAWKAYLRSNLRKGDVVVSHHAPSAKSVAPWFADSDLNCFFVDPELEELILEREPELWVHGHTHDAFDYRVGKTRVLCNPLGYAGERGRNGFRPDLVLEV